MSLFCLKLNVICSCGRLTVFPFETPISQRFANVSCLRFTTEKRTTNRFIPIVRICRARTAWECLMSMSVFFFFFLFFFHNMITLFGCFRRWPVFCQACVQMKLSPLSVHCYITLILSSKWECFACFALCLFRTLKSCCL